VQKETDFNLRFYDII